MLAFIHVTYLIKSLDLPRWVIGDRFVLEFFHLKIIGVFTDDIWSIRAPSWLSFVDNDNRVNKDLDLFCLFLWRWVLRAFGFVSFFEYPLDLSVLELFVFLYICLDLWLSRLSLLTDDGWSCKSDIILQPSGRRIMGVNALPWRKLRGLI